MTHHVHPYAHRLGIIRGWKSRWFAGKDRYRDLVKADGLIRDFLYKRLRGHFVAGIDIERSHKATKIIISSSRPGMIIGRQGETANKLRKTLARFLKKNDIIMDENFKIDILGVDSPESNAAIVASMVIDALEKRMPFRRVMKQTIEKIMSVRGVKGARIVLAGRLGGAEMSRKEEVKRGGIPLQFIRADIDYHRDIARLPYGVIGVKVWIYKGDTLKKDQYKD